MIKIRILFHFLFVLNFRLEYLEFLISTKYDKNEYKKEPLIKSIKYILPFVVLNLICVMISTTTRLNKNKCILIKIFLALNF